MWPNLTSLARRVGLSIYFKDYEEFRMFCNDPTQRA